MISNTRSISTLTRSESSECVQACFAAHQAGDGDDACVKQKVARFVHGGDATAIANGTRLLRRVIQVGARNPSAAAATWFAALSRMEGRSPAFAAARRIALFRVEQSGHAHDTAADTALLGEIATELGRTYPGRQGAIASARACMAALLRGIDWTGWSAACLAQLHPLSQLAALDSLQKNPDYATALGCTHEGLAAGVLCLQAGTPSTAEPSAVAERIVILTGCENVAVENAVAEDPEMDPACARAIFRSYYMPEVAVRLDRALSPGAMRMLARMLDTPAVQEAFKVQTAALPEVARQRADLLYDAALLIEGPRLLRERCG